MFIWQNKGEYLYAEISGVYSLEMFISAIHEVAEHCKNENLKKVLIDLRNVDGNPSILDRYHFGVEIAKTWGPIIKVAAVGKTEVINQMAENTALNRGANLWATPDIELALQWLGIEHK